MERKEQKEQEGLEGTMIYGITGLLALEMLQVSLVVFLGATNYQGCFTQNTYRGTTLVTLFIVFSFQIQRNQEGLA